MGDRESYDKAWPSWQEAEMIRQMEIELMWGKIPIVGRVFQPTLYQTHQNYLKKILILTGIW